MSLPRSRLIHLCLLLTLGLVAAAVAVRLAQGAAGRELLAVASPVFFGIAAKKGAHLGVAAVILALVGLLFAAGALIAAISAGR